MEAFTVSRLIEDIGATSSRGEKEELVAQLAALPLGRFVITWAYDPFVSYGVTAAPTKSAGGKIEFRETLIEPLLTKLATRQLTGHAADREIGDIMQMLDKDGANLLYLILNKDLKCGIAASTINAAVPGLVPVFAVMRAHTYEPKRMTSTRRAEYKLDGNRNTFLCKDGKGGFFTRSGKRVPQLDFLVPAVIKVAHAAATVEGLAHVLRRPGEEHLNFMLDGEAMMGLFENTGALRRKGVSAHGAELHLYDMMSYDDFDADGAVGDPQEVRRANVEKFVRIAKTALDPDDAEVIQIVPSFFVNDDAEVQARFEQARSKTLASYLARGDEAREKALLDLTIDKATGKPKVLEGIVIKDPKALYEKKKSHAWLKLKAEETEDLRIIGVFSGKEGTKYETMLGGAIVDRLGVEVRVGGGWSDAEREEMWKLWELDAAILGVSPDVGFKGQAFGPVSLRAAGAKHFLTRLLEVEFMEVTPDGSLRHPRAIRLRDDKDGEVEDKEKLAA